MTILLENEVLRVTPNGEFIWNENADQMIEEGDYSASPSTQHILRALRKQRTWQGLTQDEFKQIMLDTYNIDLNVPGHSSDDHLLWRAIEAKLKEKNT